MGPDDEDLTCDACGATFDSKEEKENHTCGA